jgi:thioredoxin reductase (NADPH)
MAERAMAHPSIEFSWHSQVSEIVGESAVSAVRLKDLRSGDEREIPAEGVFVAIGHNPRSDLFAGQVRLDREGYVVVKGSGVPGGEGHDRTTATSADGVFACGDVVDRTYRQAITAAASGASAALDAQDYLTELEADAVIATATM